MLYYDSRADESDGERKQAQALERRRMYPENYTMQNKLEETLTARCNIVVKDLILRSTKQQFFYKNDILSQQALK